MRRRSRLVPTAQRCRRGILIAVFLTFAPGPVFSAALADENLDICTLPEAAEVSSSLTTACDILSLGREAAPELRAEAFYTIGQFWQLSGQDPTKAETAYLAAWEIYADHCELIWPQPRWVSHGGDSYMALSTFYGFDAHGKEDRCSYEMGRRFNEDREHVHAVRFFTRAIAQGRELVTSYYLRGVEHSRSGDFELALEDYNRALAIDPANAEVALALKELEKLVAD